MNEVTQAIAEFIFRDTGLPVSEGEKVIEVPKEPQWGDYAFPCFILARRLKKAPAVLAPEVASKFQPAGFLANCTPAGGYLNFRIRRPAWAERVLRRIFSQGEHYGESQERMGKKVLIEFSSPNIA